MRICSLLPSATEIVFGLGMGHALVGVSHECDYPEAARRIAKVTRSKIPATSSSAQIDRAVSATLDQQGTLYELDLPLLEQLQPELILTQRLCDVCAVSFDRVQEAVEGLRSRPRILNLEPHSLRDIFENIHTVGQALGHDCAAQALVDSLERRADAVRSRTKGLAHRPRVFCMEWVHPPYCGGHWMKELVEIAGGRDDLSNLHRPSYRIEWTRVLEFAPEVVVLTCCGFDLGRCEREGEVLAKFEGVQDLPAARAGRIFATDGSAYFSRPGPRIVESLEILAHLIHPELFPAPPLSRAFSTLDLLSVGAVRG
ncbi:MAG TPA: cobalamin-binding protein [Candidatus Acidoferrales bacterium]|nr:cobalamin-binding protein [Candidatus Acidoferrales bacterium]